MGESEKATTCSRSGSWGPFKNPREIRAFPLTPLGAIFAHQVSTWGVGAEAGSSLAAAVHIHPSQLFLAKLPGHPKPSSPCSHPASRTFPPAPPSWSLFLRPLPTLEMFLFQAQLCCPGLQSISSLSAVCGQKPNSNSGLGLPGGFGMCHFSNSGIVRLYSHPIAGFCQRSELHFWMFTQRPPASVHTLSHSQHLGMNLLKSMMNSQHKLLIRP